MIKSVGATHKIEVFLKSGETLRTEDAFEANEDPSELIEAEIDDRESAWKVIGHLTLRFDSIVGFAVEAL